jgi:cell division inhibitor SepF
MNDVVALSHSMQANYQLAIVRPRSVSDMDEVVQALRGNKAVIINLEQLENREAQRISDFVAGSTYAISGSQSKLGEGVFLFTPSNFKIQDRGRTEASIAFS